MKSALALSGRVIATLFLAGLACFLGWRLWSYYIDAPWTRDGKIRADVVLLGPDVSGLVAEVNVRDNQAVKKGDILFRIDDSRFKLALAQAQAQLESSKAALDQAQFDDALYHRLDSTSTEQRRQQAKHALGQAQASVDQANVAVQQAQLDIERSVVHASANGKVTNFSLRPGAYVGSGQPVVALVESDSYYVTGYFDEIRLGHVRVGSPVKIYLMGRKDPIDGKVTGIAAGIADSERSDGVAALATVAPTFSWVRLAQRIPVRIEVDGDPEKLGLVAGQTAGVYVVSESGG